jgi:hypothetical protein
MSIKGFSSDDESWGSFSDFSLPVVGDDSADQSAQVAAAVQAQVDFLDLVEKDHSYADNFPFRALVFFNTIVVLLSEGHFDRAQQILFESEAKDVWQQSPLQRAKVYTLLIENILEKEGVHENARNLYSRGLGANVWEGFLEQQETAKQVLCQAGFKIA